MKQISRPQRLARVQLGMALIECLMAMLIFSFGLLGLAGLEARVMNFSVDSENRSRAAVFASEISSQMWLNGTVAPTTPEYNALLTKVNDMSQGGLPSGTVTVAAPAVLPPGTTNVRNITITWQETADATPSQLTTQVILP
jgi:type IV pilus assembly protein PilV